MNSKVTNVSEAEIVCLLFNETFGVISKVTHQEQVISSKTNAKEIHAVGCGVEGSLLAETPKPKREFLPTYRFYIGYTYLMTLGLLCLWTPYSPLSNTC